MSALTILIAGPYRSGTDNNPALIAQNLQTLEEAAWQVYRKGHLPLIGEWIALPLAARAAIALDAHDVPAEFLYGVARRAIAQCDAVYRIPGASRGADGDMAAAAALGLRCFHALDEIPYAT